MNFSYRFSDQVISNCAEIRPVGTALIHTGTDGHEEADRRFSRLCERTQISSDGPDYGHKEVETHIQLAKVTKLVKSKVNVHPCTGTEALYRPYGP